MAATGADPMTTQNDRPQRAGIRREPPLFCEVHVLGTRAITPRMVRVSLSGDDLAGLTVDEPASSVRLLLPDIVRRRLIIPIWNGNRFVFDDGTTPIIRTMTPVNFDAAATRMDLDIVVHRGGAASSWAQSCRPGDEAAISGTARGYAIDSRAPAYVLAGDETALPAIIQIVAGVPAGIPVVALIEAADGAARTDFASRPDLAVRWVVVPPGAVPGAALLPALSDVDMPVGCKVWAAGEAGAMHRVRRHLTDKRGLDRADFTVRGYWKHGR